MTLKNEEKYYKCIARKPQPNVTSVINFYYFKSITMNARSAWERCYARKIFFPVSIGVAIYNQTHFGSFKTFFFCFFISSLNCLPWLPKKIWVTGNCFFSLLDDVVLAFRVPLLLLVRGTLWWQSQGERELKITDLLNYSHATILCIIHYFYS